MERDGSIFLPQIRELYPQTIAEYTMPVFHEPRMTSVEANTGTWEEFKEKLQPLSVVQAGSADLELIVSPKYVGWGVEDVNVFAGHNSRTVNEISDLSEIEGASFFGLNLLLAREVVQERGADSAQVSIGFNTEDFSMGHHSIIRLHSHIRAISPADIHRHDYVGWNSLERFEKLGLIEPFSPLYYDYALHLIKGGLLADYLEAMPTHHAGFVSMDLYQGPDSAAVFDQLRRLYVAFRDEHKAIVELFTDGSRDPLLDRYIPRHQDERRALLGEFLLAREGIYSETSQQLLRYLAASLHKAESRNADDPWDMSTPSKIYISRGFSGAMTFALDQDKSSVRFDYLPRVITTSGIVKTLNGKNAPTVMARQRSTASLQEQQINASYNDFMRGAVLKVGSALQ